MKWATVSLMTVSAIALTSLPAFAGVDVDPVQLRPGLFIDAEKLLPGRSGTPSKLGTTNPVGDKDPFVVPVTPCRVDPEVGNYGCRDVEPADPEAAPELTPDDILRAIKEIGLPALQVQVQPGDETLVNIPTIFYAEPQPFERSVRLLDFDVDLIAEPVSYLWSHGDGTTAMTTEPGRPYPSMDVVHRYTDVAKSLQPRVDVTYEVRFRVDGGPWQGVGQTVSASGPAATLEVNQAAPVLTRP